MRKLLLFSALILFGFSSAPALAQFSDQIGPTPCAYIDCTVNSLGAGVAAPGGGQIQSSGQITSGADIQVQNGNALKWNGRGMLSSPGAGQIQQGAGDVAGSPVAQTWSYQSASSVPNTNGANTTIDLSAGTGTGTGGNLVINGAPHSTTGSSKNAYSTIATFNGDVGTLTMALASAGASAPQYAMIGANTGLLATGIGNIALTVNGTIRADYNISTSNVWTFAAAIRANQLTLLQNVMTLQGNITTPAWTTSGISLMQSSATFQDTTTASGTLATEYINALHAPTLAFTNTGVTVTNAYDTYFEKPVAGTNATLTNSWAIGADSALINGPTTINNANFKVTTLGVSTAVDTVCYASSTGLFTEEPTGTTCTVSARRFKQDINYLSDAHMLDEVLGMKPVSFRFKKGVGQDDGVEVHYGLIAEDVAKVAPELVAYEKGGQTHGVKYGDGELQSHLIGAIKGEHAEVSAQLKAQQEEIYALFGMILALVGWNVWLTVRR